jgi:hypothetical protein
MFLDNLSHPEYSSYLKAFKKGGFILFNEDLQFEMFFEAGLLPVPSHYGSAIMISLLGFQS